MRWLLPEQVWGAHLEQEGCWTRVTVVPPGFDFQELYVDSRNSLPPSVLSWLASRRGCPVIAQVGNIGPGKRARIYVEFTVPFKNEWTTVLLVDCGGLVRLNCGTFTVSDWQYGHAWWCFYCWQCFSCRPRISGCQSGGSAFRKRIFWYGAGRSIGDFLCL